MAPKIRILDDTAANRIAAGEVVERPASVLRELLDNSLDAGATSIQVEVRRGGKSLISVSDNGAGMSREDALLALERHATSKIDSAEDLEDVMTLGFRGEALPSMASVSRFTLQTREPESVAGTEVIVDGGKIRNVQDAGCPPGTHIEVRSLFFHTPGRRKFLKSDLTEQAHCDQVLKAAALANPEVAFHYRSESVRLDYPEVSDWNERIRQVLGREWERNTLLMEKEDRHWQVRGRIGRPGVSRSDRQESLLFVNGRRITHRGIQFAILEGCRQSLIKGRYPVHVIFIEVPASEIDVNVHPAKQEVKFRDEARVRSLVAGVVSRTLLEAAGGSSPDPAAHVSSQAGPRIEWARPRPEQAPLIQVEKSAGESKSGSASTQPEAAGHPHHQKHDLTVHGTMLERYIIAENDQGAVMVDVRASRERILFEESLQNLHEEAPVSQRLLVPVNIELAPDMAEWTRANLERLQSLGLGVAELGGSTFLIDALPPQISGTEVSDFIRELIHALMSGASGKKSASLADEALAAGYARQAARRIPFPSDPEIDVLLNDLHACDLPYTDPAGHPTMILFSREELERRFARK
jgi:DNA mismatch repair protein MutL